MAGWNEQEVPSRERDEQRVEEGQRQGNRRKATEDEHVRQEGILEGWGQELDGQERKGDNSGPTERGAA